MSDTNYESVKDQILAFLKEFNWEPISVTEKEGLYTIVLVADLDIKQVNIQIKFSETSHWVYFSSIFLPSIQKNQTEIYRKLLEINYATTMTKFGMSPQGNVYALIEFPLKSMQYSEFISALRRLTNDLNKFLLPIASLLAEEKPE